MHKVLIKAFFEQESVVEIEELSCLSGIMPLSQHADNCCIYQQWK